MGVDWWKITFEIRQSDVIQWGWVLAESGKNKISLSRLAFCFVNNWLLLIRGGGMRGNGWNGQGSEVKENRKESERERESEREKRREMTTTRARRKGKNATLFTPLFHEQGDKKRMLGGRMEDIFLQFILSPSSLVPLPTPYLMLQR